MKEYGTQIAALSSMGKVSYSSNGIIVPDNTNKQLLYLFNDGTLINTLPMSQTSQIALAYEQNHQLVYQAQEAVSFKHLFIDKTPPEAAPKALAQRFVQAYLNDNEAIMREITSQRWIDQLKRQEVKATEVFTNMISYHENIYLHGLKAVVFGKTRVTEGELSIKFYFIWVKGKWVLNKII
jgi:hypothetical protein